MKIIQSFLALTIIIYCTNSYAAEWVNNEGCNTICSAENPDQDNICPFDATACDPGCFLTNLTEDVENKYGYCSQCPPGTFMASKHHIAEQCAACSGPGTSLAELVKDQMVIEKADLTFCYDQSKPEGKIIETNCLLYMNTSTYACPWVYKCADGQYYANGSCQSCGDGYEGVGEWTFVGNGDHVETTYEYSGSDSGSKQNRCEGISYTISLNTNNPYDYLPSYGGKNYEDHDITFKFGTGLTKGHSSATKLADSSLQPSAPYYVFKGYYTASDGGDLVFKANGSLVDTNLEAELWLTATDLYAQYTINDFHIWYEKTMPGSALSRTADATYDVTNSSRLAKSYNPDWFEDGELITGYICVLNDGTGTGCGTYQPGDNITFPENGQQMGRVLYARTEICPAGYYCYDNEDYECPGGSTSNEGSGSISDCYMSAETQFIDKTGAEFTLGELLGNNAKIYRY